MTDESFVGTKNALKTMLKSNELLTSYIYVEAMLYHSEQCTLKVLWRSSSKNPASIGFRKGSPLLPFFKNIYHKLRQTAALSRLKQNAQML